MRTKGSVLFAFSVWLAFSAVSAQTPATQTGAPPAAVSTQAVSAGTGSSGGSFLSIGVEPNFVLPLGSDAKLFGFGAGSSIDFSWRPAARPLFFAGIGLGYASATPPAVKWFPAQKTGMIAGFARRT